LEYQFPDPSSIKRLVLYGRNHIKASNDVTLKMGEKLDWLTSQSKKNKLDRWITKIPIGLRMKTAE
jgi:hypothetical protein